MKKAMMFAMMTVLGAMFLLPAAAQAQYGWHECIVTYAGPAGPNSDEVYLRLTDAENSPPAFTNITRLAAQGREKEMLAVALTAMSNQMIVRVRVNPTAHLSEVRSMFLLPPTP